MADQRQFAGGGIYHIRVRGHLDEKWTSWLEGFVIVSADSGETLLSGGVVDQAALHGVLDKLHGLGLPLLLVIHADFFTPTQTASLLRDARNA